MSCLDEAPAIVSLSCRPAIMQIALVNFFVVSSIGMYMLREVQKKIITKIKNIKKLKKNYKKIFF